MKHIVCNERDKKLYVEQKNFKTNKKTWKKNVNIVKKQYGFVYDKRVLLI